MKDPIEFSDREKYIIHFYRDAQKSMARSAVVEDLPYLLPSLACVTLYFWRGALGFGLVGYGILLWRVAHSLFTGTGYAEDFRSIFQKYDAKIRELTEALEKKEIAK
jgi:hypothetical protein